MQMNLVLFWGVGRDDFSLFWGVWMIFGHCLGRGGGCYTTLSIKINIQNEG